MLLSVNGAVGQVAALLNLHTVTAVRKQCFLVSSRKEEDPDFILGPKIDAGGIIMALP